MLYEEWCTVSGSFQSCNEGCLKETSHFGVKQVNSIPIMGAINA